MPLKFWFLRYVFGVSFFCPPTEGGTTEPPPEPPKGGTPPPPADDSAALKAKIAELEAKLKATPPPGDDPDLNEKARRAREAAEKDTGRIKRLESAITFNMKSTDFLKANASLLPTDVADVFKAAEKENYADAAEKADAIKAGMIQSFFSVQENEDLLTPGQKAQLDDYRKLTKNGKQDKAQALYDMVFEPAFEMLKRTRKAEALKRGHGIGSDVDEAYKNRLMSGSAKHYRLEKK